MKKLGLLFLSLTMLCGCQDKKNLLDILFPSSMAINYQDGQYQVAFQIDNLATVAKTELESSTQQTILLVASGKGESLEEAINQIEETERSVINLSHIRSVILLPGAIDLDVQKDICNFATMNPQLRLDADVYYTKEELKDIYTTNFQISRSELYTLSNSPDFKKVSTMLKSINLLQLSKAINDKNITVEMPVLELNHENLDTYMTNDGETEQKVYNIKQLMYLNDSFNQKETIDFTDLEGIQWVTSHHDDVDVNIEIEGNGVHAVSSSVKAMIVYNPFSKTYHLKGTINLVVTRDLGLRDISEIQPYLQEEIYQQIAHTYQTGLQKDIDVYNMRYKSMLFGHDTKPDSHNFYNELEVKAVMKGSYIGAY